MIQIPRHSDTNPTEIKLVFTNCLTNQIVEPVINGFELFPLTYMIEISNIVEPDGEYTYKVLNENGEELERGLAVFGDYKRAIKTYEKSNKKIQYNR